MKERLALSNVLVDQIIRIKQTRHSPSGSPIPPFTVIKRPSRDDQNSTINDDREAQNTPRDVDDGVGQVSFHARQRRGGVGNISRVECRRRGLACGRGAIGVDWMGSGFSA